jgi:hypothetical protein
MTEIVPISKSLLVHGIRYWRFLPAAEDFTQIARFSQIATRLLAFLVLRRSPKYIAA